MKIGVDADTCPVVKIVEQLANLIRQVVTVHTLREQ